MLIFVFDIVVAAEFVDCAEIPYVQKNLCTFNRFFHYVYFINLRMDVQIYLNFNGMFICSVFCGSAFVLIEHTVANAELMMKINSRTYRMNKASQLLIYHFLCRFVVIFLNNK